jgi:hypothetical protein
MSKGSRPRPFSVSQQEYDTRWDAIFSRDGLDDKPAKSAEPAPADVKQPTDQPPRLNLLQPGRT